MNIKKQIMLLLALFIGLSSTPSFAAGKSTTTESQFQQTGIASFYARKFNGRKTANGEIYSDNLLTAAHRTLPLGTVVKVTNLRNGRQVTVRINDRGPFIKGRIIDLSRRAAGEIGMIHGGLTQVKVEVIKLSGKVKAQSVAKNPPKTAASKNTAAIPQGKFSVEIRVKSEKEAKRLAKKLKASPQIRVENGRYALLLAAESQAEINKIKQQLNKLGQFQIFTYSK